MKNIFPKIFHLSQNKSKLHKKWTLLIYANGNNDLALETYQNFQRIRNICSHEDIQVIVQLALAPWPLVKTLRPNLPYASPVLYESGVYRYLFEDQDAKLIDILGNLNMAVPRNLADFISWGVSRYPAKHTMLLLSGHGAGFAGMLTDYTYEQPYIMPISGLIDAISLCKKNTGKSIDCLILDSCYMNMIEIGYELALAPNTPVKYLISPLKNLGIEGLPWDQIIRQLQESSHQTLDLPGTIQNIVYGVNQYCGIFNNVMGIRIVKKHYFKLKSAVNQMADWMLSHPIQPAEWARSLSGVPDDYPLVGLLDLCEALATHFSAKQSEILQILEDILLCPPLSQLPKNQNLGPSIYLPKCAEQYSIIKKHYEKLLFSAHNRRLQLLPQHSGIQNHQPSRNKSRGTLPAPLCIPIGSVAGVILGQNPNLTPRQAWQIIGELGWDSGDLSS